LLQEENGGEKIMCKRIPGLLMGAILLLGSTAHARPIEPPVPPRPFLWTTSVKTSLPISIADDFTVKENGLLSNVLIKGSWENNKIGKFKAIHISIMDDARGKPGNKLWETYIENPIVKRFNKTRGLFHWYFDPLSGNYHPNKAEIFQIDMPIESDCLLKEGEKYWISITALPAEPDTTSFGWLTSLSLTPYPHDSYTGNAQWSIYEQQDWKDLEIPPAGINPDMNFSIKTEVSEPATILLLAFGSILVIPLYRRSVINQS